MPLVRSHGRGSTGFSRRAEKSILPVAMSRRIWTLNNHRSSGASQVRPAVFQVNRFTAVSYAQRPKIVQRTEDPAEARKIPH